MADDAGHQPLHISPARAPEGSLTPEAAAAVGALKDKLAAEVESWNAAAAAEGAALLDDFTLHRFLLARPESVEAALGMVRTASEWRAERNISRLHAELRPTAEPATSERARLVQRHFYAGRGGVTRDGSPFFIERLGRADLSGYARNPALLALMLDAYAAYLEDVFRSVREASARRGTLVRAIIVVDASGASLSTLRHIGIIKQVASIGPPHFPEGSSRVLIINAPRILAIIWGAISPLLPARTRAKVCFHAEGTTAAALDEIIDAPELPAFLGGVRPDAQCAVPEAQPVPEAVAEFGQNY